MHVQPHHSTKGARLWVLVEGFAESLGKLVGFFQAVNSMTDEKLKGEEMDSFKTSLTDIIHFLTNNYKSNNKYKSILPTKVSLTFDGIGGIIIGNIFIEKDNHGNFKNVLIGDWGMGVSKDDYLKEGTLEGYKELIKEDYESKLQEQNKKIERLEKLIMKN
jgi:hypothetical protein